MVDSISKPACDAIHIPRTSLIFHPNNMFDFYAIFLYSILKIPGLDWGKHTENIRFSKWCISVSHTCVPSKSEIIYIYISVFRHVFIQFWYAFRFPTWFAGTSPNRWDVFRPVLNGILSAKAGAYIKIIWQSRGLHFSSSIHLPSPTSRGFPSNSWDATSGSSQDSMDSRGCCARRSGLKPGVNVEDFSWDLYGNIW